MLIYAFNKELEKDKKQQFTDMMYLIRDYCLFISLKMNIYYNSFNKEYYFTLDVNNIDSIIFTASFYNKRVKFVEPTKDQQNELKFLQPCNFYNAIKVNKILYKQKTFFIHQFANTQRYFKVFSIKDTKESLVHQFKIVTLK